MNTSNSIELDKNIGYYIDNIYLLCDEYINNLDTDLEKANNKINKSPAFRGMLKYIYLKLFKPGKGENIYQNSIQRNSNLNYDNIELLNNIWDIYTSLCYKYNQIPTILNYSILTGISLDWFNDVKNGKIRSGDGGASSAHCQSVKRWLAECEAGLYDGAAAGNPGPMFLLKSNYGYTEQPQQIQVIGTAPQQTKQEIAAKYANFKELPEPPKGL